MTGEDVKALYKYARSGSGSPYGNIYTSLTPPPAGSALQNTAEGMGQTGVFFGRNLIPGVGHLTRIPQVLPQRHYINLARKAGLYPKGPQMSLGKSLTRKGFKSLGKEWDQFVKAMGKEHADDVIFKTWSRMRPKVPITGSALKKLTKATRFRTTGAAMGMVELPLEVIDYMLKRPRILKANRAKGYYIGKKNPFLKSKAGG